MQTLLPSNSKQKIKLIVYSIIFFSWVIFAKLMPLGFLPGLIFLASLFLERKLAIFAHIMLAIGILLVAIHVYLPFDDQYLLYGILKPIDFLSTYVERPLYSSYRIFSENVAGTSGTAKACEYWDYTYLPLSIMPSTFYLPFGADPKIVFFLLYLIGAWINIRLSDQQFRVCVSAILLASPAPIVLGLYSLSNTALVPLAVSLLRLAMLLPKNNFISPLLLAASMLINQTTWIFAPFTAFYFFKKQRIRSVLAGAFISLSVLGFFAWNNLTNFLKSALLQHVSLTDAEVFKDTGQLSPLTLSGIIQKLFHLQPEIVLELLPRYTICIVSLTILLIITIIKPNKSANFSIAIGALASILTIFIIKISWLDFRYFLGPVLGAAVIGSSEESNIQPKTINRYVITAIIFSLSCLTISKLLITRNLSWKEGESKKFELPQSDEIDSLPRFSLFSGYGIVPTRAGTQFWVVTPPGSYQIQDTDGNKIPFFINQQKSFGLRLALGWQQTSSQLFILPNDDVAFPYPNPSFINLNRKFEIKKLN